MVWRWEAYSWVLRSHLVVNQIVGISSLPWQSSAKISNRLQGFLKCNGNALADSPRRGWDRITIYCRGPIPICKTIFWICPKHVAPWLKEKEVFETMPMRDIAPRNAMITCYAKSGNIFEPWSFRQKCWVRRWNIILDCIICGFHRSSWLEPL